jgi:hypothetical protein
MEARAVSDDAAGNAVYSKAKASRFSFKARTRAEPGAKRGRRGDVDAHAERASKRREAPEDDDGDGEPRPRQRDSRRKHRHRQRRSHEDRHHPTSTVDGEYYDPDHRHRESLFDALGHAPAAPAPGADAAFRESLFDALADDEGAAYWEGVYGQPVHVYADTKPGPDGTLERMTEDEYADYVRGKMWEKSHQHILEAREAEKRARERRRAQRAPLDDDIAQQEQERDHIRRQMEASLKRGAERSRAREAGAAWANYTKKWEELKAAQGIAHEHDARLSNLIPWPVVSGKVQHVCSAEIERFLQSSSAWKGDPAAMLKMERVRWHPDKMQQRLGQHIDLDTMRSVTAVFQVIDRLWTERR